MANATSWCPFSKTLLGFHAASGIRRLTPIRCKRWTCPPCAAKNTAAIIHRIRFAMPQKFITLTAWPRPGETPELIYARVRPMIPRLVQLIRRRFGKFECCLITELTQKGNPHWHLVARCGFIPQRWLSDTWQSLTGACIVDIRQVKGGAQVAGYVAKYITKLFGQARPEWLKRGITYTRGFPRPPRLRLPRDWQWLKLMHSPAMELEHYADNQFTKIERDKQIFIIDRALDTPFKVILDVLREFERGPPVVSMHNRATLNTETTRATHAQPHALPHANDGQSLALSTDN